MLSSFALLAVFLVNSPSEVVSAAESERGRLQTIFQQIETSEYELSWHDNVGAYRCPNRAQNLRLTFYQDGFAMEPRVYAGAAPPWTARLKLVSWSKDPEVVAEVDQVQWAVKGSAAEAHASGLDFQYTNSKEGLRQSFLVKERLLGRETLRLRFQVEVEGVKLLAGATPTEIVFADGQSEPVAAYKDLRVLDAVGRELEAAMVIEGDDSFGIVVDDRDAVYPILVDPLASVIGYAGSQSGAQFGYSVAGGPAEGGDVDDDGYDDVLIGAPYAEDNNSNEGKAYLYLGSSSGIGSTASWSAAGGQSNAHFGWAVALGELDNDDSNADLMIGSPDYDSTELSLTNNGRARFYKGASTPTWDEDVIGLASSDQNGFSVAYTSDIDIGGGTHGFVVGAPGNNSGTGAVSVVKYSSE